ncbi:MAG: hypothetical protein F4157_07945 [Synechococcus sp. SB0675_bin_6]|nr:hypothetical protein [Synechococcus sp. SB0675_bin_6]
MKKKKQRPQGFGEMKRGAGSPTSAKTGKSTKEAEITYGALVEEARICWMSGRTQEVISLLREAIAVNPKHPQAYYNLGNVLRGAICKLLSPITGKPLPWIPIIQKSMSISAMR